MGHCSETYDALADRYDDWSARVVPDVREDWARKADGFLSAGERVVELGCGTGTPVGRSLSTRYEYAGVDASSGMLAKVREVLPDAPLTLGDMHEVDFPAESLGAVFAFYSVSHTPRELHATLFARIASWLRPGGVFIGNLASRDDPDGFDADWLGAGPMRWSGFDDVRNRALLTEAGFTVLEAEAIDHVEPEGTKIRPLWFVARVRRSN